MIAGCDGFHGVCRPSIPAGVLREFSREYPFGWLGILAACRRPRTTRSSTPTHERGFALLSMRSLELSRLYVQCRPDEDLDEWPDDRIWEELQLRLGLDGWTLREGPVLEKGVTGMRSFVAEPMQLRPALPRGRRCAHRAADGSEGTQPRDPRRARPRGGDRGLVPNRLDHAPGRVLGAPASAACGARSTSRGG